MTRLPILRTILNGWTTRPVDTAGGVVTLHAVTPDGQHVIVTLTDAEARMIGDALTRAAEDAPLNRMIGEERYDLPCGCDVRDVDASDGDHRMACPIRQTFV
jgi:hypothetical protein